MNVLMIILCIALATESVFLISKYGFKRKESEEYVSSGKKEFY